MKRLIPKNVAWVLFWLMCFIQLLIQLLLTRIHIGTDLIALRIVVVVICIILWGLASAVLIQYVIRRTISNIRNIKDVNSMEVLEYLLANKRFLLCPESNNTIFKARPNKIFIPKMIKLLYTIKQCCYNYTEFNQLVDEFVKILIKANQLEELWSMDVRNKHIIDKFTTLYESYVNKLETELQKCIDDTTYKFDYEEENR